MCTPDNIDTQTIKSYYTNIKHFIINNIIYFYPFFVYYFHGYSDLSIDFLKMINEQHNKHITLKDVFSKFSTIHSDKKKIVYINACQGSVYDKEICYLYIGFDDDVIIHWNKIHITEMIVIYVQNYLIYNIK